MWSSSRCSSLLEREIYDRLLGRQGEDRELFLCVLILGCLQLKVILRPKWHIWGDIS